MEQYKLKSDLVLKQDPWPKKSMLQKSFDKAAGFTKRLDALHKKYPDFKAKVTTSRASIYHSNVNVETNIPLEGHPGKLSAKVYSDGAIVVEYGVSARPNRVGYKEPLAKVFKGFRASSKAAAFIKEKAIGAYLIP